MIPIARWVSPFRYPRIKACSQLPVAFRSVPRLSSPPDAKASTECPSHAHTLHMHSNHPRSRASDALQRKCIMSHAKFIILIKTPSDRYTPQSLNTRSRSEPSGPKSGNPKPIHMGQTNPDRGSTQKVHQPIHTDKEQTFSSLPHQSAAEKKHFSLNL